MKKFRLKLRCGLFCALLLLVITPCLTFAQSGDIKVTGNVADEKDAPLPGVTVKIKDGTGGTQTSINGTFTLTVKGNATLVFTMVGYNTVEMPVNNKTSLTVHMIENTTNLEDVVVVAYGTQKKATISGAISSITSADLDRTPAVAATSALVGKIAGVTARTTDARPGNGATINIRNLGNPLYIIDGVPYSTNNTVDAFGLNVTQQSGINAFNELGLDDIESVTVLKDASTSLYGLAAANGVILVTTKHGKKGEAPPRLGVSGYYGIQNYTRYGTPSTAGQYVLAQDQSTQNLNLQNLTNPANPLPYSNTELSNWANQVDQAHLNNDYFKAVNNPNVPQYNLSANVSGGSKNSSYYVSFGDVSQDAVIKDYSFTRQNFQANISSTLADGLTVTANVSGHLQHTHNVGVPGLDDYFNPFLSILSMLPTEKEYANDNPMYINQTHNVNVNPATYKESVTGFTDDLDNDVALKLSGEYTFKFGLTLKALYDYEFGHEYFDNFEYTYNAYIYNPKSGNYDNRPDLADGVTPDLTAGLYGNQNPYHESHRRDATHKFSQVTANYQHQFGDHNISAVVAYERNDTQTLSLVSHSVPPNNIIGIQYFADLDTFNDTRVDERTESVAFKLDYDYKKKYILEGVARYDGTYIYQPGHQYGFFPGVSAAWRINEEPFFKKKFGDWVDNLKLRASYGLSGTIVGVNAFDYLAGYNVNSGSAVFQGTYVSGVTPRALPTTNLTWTTNSIANVGFDFDILHHLTGTFDVFVRSRSGLPASRYDVLIPTEVGYTLPNANLNGDKTQGFDGQITYTGKAGQLTYSLGTNFTLARTENTTIYKPRYGNSYDQWRNGVANRWSGNPTSNTPVGPTFGHHIIGQFTSQAQINSYPVNIDGQGNRTLLPGDFIYEDYNHDGVINALDEKPIGYAQGALPYFNYGLNGFLGYKNFTLNLDFSGATMQTFFRDFELKYPFQNGGNSAQFLLTDVWHKADVTDNNSAWVPGTYPSIRVNSNGLSIFTVPAGGAAAANNDFWLTNVHYIRLRDAILGYSIPPAITKKFGINGLRVYVEGANLFSFDNVSKFQIDPEISSTNGLVYPQQRIYTVGFNLSL